MNHQIHAYWQRFVTTHRLENAHYDAWAFGDDAETANQLAELVVKGIKTATTSALEDYESNEPLPKAGDYNMILWADGTPACITQTKVVEIVPYKWVSAEHAFHEGEGDRSLTYWRTVHEAFFKNEYQRLKQSFPPPISRVFVNYSRLSIEMRVLQNKSLINEKMIFFSKIPLVSSCLNGLL